MKKIKEIDKEMLVNDLEEISELLNDVIERVIEVNDYETMVALEDLLEEENQYARSRDLTKKINEKIREKEWFDKGEVIEV